MPNKCVHHPAKHIQYEKVYEVHKVHINDQSSVPVDQLHLTHGILLPTVLAGAHFSMLPKPLPNSHHNQTEPIIWNSPCSNKCPGTIQPPMAVPPANDPSINRLFNHIAINISGSGKFTRGQISLSWEKSVLKMWGVISCLGRRKCVQRNGTAWAFQREAPLIWNWFCRSTEHLV